MRRLFTLPHSIKKSIRWAPTWVRRVLEAFSRFLGLSTNHSIDDTICNWREGYLLPTWAWKITWRPNTAKLGGMTHALFYVPQRQTSILLLMALLNAVKTLLQVVWHRTLWLVFWEVLSSVIQIFELEELLKHSSGKRKKKKCAAVLFASHWGYGCAD